MAYWITTVLVMLTLGVYAFYMRHPTVAAVLNGKVSLPERETAALDALLADAGVLPDRVRVVYADPHTPCWSHAYRKWWESKLRVYRRFGRFGENCIGIDRGQVISVSLVDTHLADMTPLADLPALRHLQLRDARIEALAGIPPDCQWTEVNLAQNALTDLAPLTCCTALERLDVSFNRLAVLPDLKPLARLEWLEASNNELTDISGLAHHPALKSIHLSVNRLTSAQGLDGLPRLESLLLGSNDLTSLRGLKNLPRLRWLNAYGNQLQTLDLPSDSPALGMIDVSGNPIRDLPSGFTYTGGEHRGPTLTTIDGKFVRIGIVGTPLAETLSQTK